MCLTPPHGFWHSTCFVTGYLSLSSAVHIHLEFNVSLSLSLVLLCHSASLALLTLYVEEQNSGVMMPTCGVGLAGYLLHSERKQGRRRKEQAWGNYVNGSHELRDP